QKSIKLTYVLIFSILVFSLVLSGCSAEATPDETTKSVETTESTNTPTNSNLFFEAKETKIILHEPAPEVLEQLGKETSYFEAESCAFEGIDKTYSYPGFDLMTYPTDGTDFISAIILRDDSVTTPEGLYIGADESEIEALHGSEYSSDKPGVYVYEQAKSKLQIIAKDGVIISIEYLAITD
ncbi:MAG: hypothetical protein GX028_02685, partial [Clostridiaceae bacterium]|nr:hypothetical protein [Clostridiaceae bacterium]